MMRRSSLLSQLAKLTVVLLLISLVGCFLADVLAQTYLFASVVESREPSANDMPIINHNIEISEDWDDGKLDLIMLMFDHNFAILMGMTLQWVFKMRFLCWQEIIVWSFSHCLLIYCKKESCLPM
jgi:hypothetical protein